MSLDGEEVAEITAASGAPDSGRVGLYRADSADDPVTDFVVRTAPHVPAYSWSFTTSAFAGFVEHIDGFSSTVYTDEALGLATGVAAELTSSLIPDAASRMETAWTALEVARAALAAADETDYLQDLIDAASGAAEALSAAAAESFESIYDVVLGEGGYRALPPVGELIEIGDDDGRYAVLIESPEPLDWTRIRVELREDSEAIDSPLLAWSEDGTRAILARSDTADGSFPDGTYELHLAYRLDVGAEAPVLRRGRSTLDEVAAISFELD